MSRKSVLDEVAGRLAQDAVRIAQVRARSMLRTAKGVAGFYPFVRDGGIFGVGIAPEFYYMHYQNTGIRPFTMWSLEGKAQPLDEPILTPTGWTTMGEIKVGDFVVGSDGKPTKVVAEFLQGEVDCFDVRFDDGTSTRCSDEHLWAVERNSSGRTEVRPLSYFRNQLHCRWGISVPSPIYMDSCELPLHPYVVGALLGDGGLTGSTPVFSCKIESGWDTFRSFLPDYVIPRLWAAEGACPRYLLSTGKLGTNHSPLNEVLRDIGIMGVNTLNKRVPDLYMMSSIEDRIFLLQGLMDTDGSCTLPNFAKFHTSSETLAAQVMSLVRSLGGKATIGSVLRLKNREYTVRMSLPDGVVPFLAPYKKKLVRYLNGRSKASSARLKKFVREVVPSGTAEMKCILVSNPDGLYVTKDYILTHNTIPMRMPDGRIVFRKAVGVGKPGKISKRDEQGRIMKGNTGVRWRHPGLPPKNFIEYGIESSLTQNSRWVKRRLMSGFLAAALEERLPTVNLYEGG